MSATGCCGSPMNGLGATFYTRGQQVPQYQSPWPEKPGGMRPPLPLSYNGVGAVTGTDVWKTLYGTASWVGAISGAYHGYKRNNGSIGWAIGWSIFGSFLPFLSIPIELAQGFGKPAGK